MNTFSRTLAASLLVASTPAILPAQEHHHHDHHDHSAHDGTGHHHHSIAGAPEQHAPAGIMVPHTHGKGSWMLGYSFMHMSMSGLRLGSHSFAEDMLPHHGYSMVPLSMDMDMHMLHLMYGLTDHITLMVMPQYIRMDMTMRMLDVHGGGHGGHGGGGGHHMPGMVHSHSVSGMDDTVVAAYIPIWSSGSHALVAQAGVSIPTGDVSIKTSDGTFTHYEMQIGSGTWDAKPGLTYTGSHGRFAWGAQGTLTIRLEDENESGYQRGNVRELSSWLGYGFLDWASVSGRLAYRHEGRLSGHYNGPHNHSSPADLQQNYGGEILEGGVGLNLVMPTGPLAGHQLGIETLWALKEDYNGIQLGRDYTVTVAWNAVF